MLSETYILSLKQIADDLVSETRRKQDQDGEFMGSWEEVRKNVLLPIFEEAEKNLEVISTCSWTVTKGCENGSSIVLKIHTPARRVHELRFTADLDKREVYCKSSLSDVVPEPFDLASLRETVKVEQKVLDFLKIALKSA